MNEANHDETTKKIKVSKENAEEQLLLLEEYYDIDEEDFLDGVDVSESEAGELEAATREGYRMAKRRLLRAIMRGHLEIKEEDNSLLVVQTLRKPPASLGKSSITYNEVSGQAKIGMQKYKDNNLYGKMYAFLAGLSRLDESIFRNLRGADLSIAESLGAVFLRV